MADIKSQPNDSTEVSLRKAVDLLGNIEDKSNSLVVGELEIKNDQNNPLPISGTVTANVLSDYYDSSNDWYAQRTVPHIEITAGEFQPVRANNPLPISGTVTVNNFGTSDDAMASSDIATGYSMFGFIKRLNTHLAALRDELGGGSGAIGGLSSLLGKRDDTAPASATGNGSLIAFLKRLNSAFDTVFGSSFLSLNNSQATFRISHPYGTFSHASPNYTISANTPQLVFSAKNTTTPRRSFQFQNVSDTPMFVGFGSSGILANPMASGAVNAVTITDGGSGYSGVPVVTFSAPTGTSGRIATATGTAVVSGGVVTSIIITDGGGGYITPPSITFSGALYTTQATATAITGSVGWYVAPSFGAVTFDRGFIPNDAVYVTCSSAGKVFVAMQA